MGETITCCYIGVNQKPQAIELPQDDILASLQKLVEGNVEVLSVRSDGIEFWINEEGLLNNMAPNMAIYADKGMEDRGFISQIDYNSTVKDGDLYTVLHGPIVAARCDIDGNTIGLDQSDIEKLQQERPDSRKAVEETIRIQRRLPPLGRDA